MNTSRKRKLPRWMIKLECEEAFVNVPPSLFSSALAVCLANNIDTSELHHVYNRLAHKEPLNIIYKNCKCLHWCKPCSPGTCLKTEKTNHYKFFSPNCTTFREGILHAYPYQHYDVVHKSLVKKFPDERKLASCKRRLFD